MQFTGWILFVKAEGYAEKQWWSKAGWQEKEEGGWQQPRYWNDSRFNLPNQPVVGVSWYEAEAYCNWLTNELNVQKDMTIRLPTEAEWECAARGIAGRRYAWGNDTPTPEHANYDETGLNRTNAVGCFPKGCTEEGLYDMAGNVWQWCQDWYAKDYYETCKQKGVVDDPTGPEKGDRRVLRGGSRRLLELY